VPHQRATCLPLAATAVAAAHCGAALNFLACLYTALTARAAYYPRCTSRCNALAVLA